MEDLKNEEELPENEAESQSPVQGKKAQDDEAGGIIDVFVNGSKKGIDLWLYMLVPGTLFGYAATQIMAVTGLLDLLGKLFAPLMAIFGLPGEAMTVLFTSVLALPGGGAAAAALASDGVLDARQITILFPMIFCLGNQVQFLGRMLSVAKVESRKYWVYVVIGIICAVLSGLIMNYLIL